MNNKMLNLDSIFRIQNLAEECKSHPMYMSYTISTYWYNKSEGMYALEVAKNGQLFNLWLFFPDRFGKIESIAVYGMFLDGHLKAIESSMTVFGMPVTSVSMDTLGKAPFVDIYLAPY